MMNSAITNIIEKLATQFDLLDSQKTMLIEAIESQLNRTIKIDAVDYALRDALPTTLIAALSPLMGLGYPVTSETILLAAKLDSATHTLSFVADPTSSGLISLMEEHTSIAKITLSPVFQGDQLEIDNRSQSVVHNRNSISDIVDGAYCIIELEDKSTILTTMAGEECREAMLANINRRLGGISPYINDVLKQEVQTTSCLRRALKSVAVNHCIDNIELISSLLYIHDEQYSQAISGNVKPFDQKFKGLSKQESRIDEIFNQTQASVVIPFQNPNKCDSTETVSDELDLSDEFGFGF